MPWSVGVALSIRCDAGPFFCHDASNESDQATVVHDVAVPMFWLAMQMFSQMRVS